MITRLLFVCAFATMVFTSCDQPPKVTYALISTEYGDMKVMLYNSTPGHRDNFIKLASEGFYDRTLFHRVMGGFMIQGGDPDSKGAPPGKQLGMGGPGYQIPAEIGALHIKGALCAARTNNPEKKSSGSQFYVVQGKPVNPSQIAAKEAKSGRLYSEAQKQLYYDFGGAIQLDFEYTVFGEVVEGMEVIDAIAAVPTNPANRPLTDVPMTVKLVEE